MESGKPPAKLFIAVGQGHGFDEMLFCGDPEFAAVEEAWKTLDEVVMTETPGTFE